MEWKQPQLTDHDVNHGRYQVHAQTAVSKETAHVKSRVRL
jgi:hypothetical protein